MNEKTSIHVAKPIWLLHIQYLINDPNYLGQNMLNLVLQCLLTFFIEESWLKTLINDCMHGAWIAYILCIELLMGYLFTSFTAYSFVEKHIIEQSWLDDLISDFMQCTWIVNILWTELFLQWFHAWCMDCIHTLHWIIDGVFVYKLYSI